MKVKILSDENTFALDIEQTIDEYGYEVIFLVPEKRMRLDTLLEDDSIDDEKLFSLKIAYQFNFKGKLLNNTMKESQEITSLKDVLEKLPDRHSLNNYRLILPSIDKVKYAKIIQQFIYLGINLDIVTEEELKYMTIYDNYTREIENLNKKILKFKKRIEEYHSGSEGAETKEKLLGRISNIQKYIGEAKERKLKIAIMATKKSGKSVIINSFLQKEYAPTSLTLPTPNAIIYEGWDKDYIELKIESDPKIKGYEKEQIFKFHSHEETREKIDSLFREAKIDDESSYKIPDMHLKLPQHLDYIIIDTPGPDLAGAEHKSIADKWMKEADAIIFASDFSKHLTNDEIKFLKDIRETLAKYDKFHSLIFTINKIDMRYQDSENKSIVKFVDFFRRRLEDMGYKGIPVMATSALEYFNVFELKRVLAKYNIKEEINYKKFDSILDELSDNSDDDLDTSEETIIDNVEGNLRKLKRFVKIKNPDLDDLIAESGMPLLLKRTDYIAKTKANVEIFKYLFRKMDNELSAIKNES